MELQGHVWKEGKFWLIEVPALDVMTQGKTKEDAYWAHSHFLGRKKIHHRDTENKEIAQR
jgi:hypothetical protein